MTHTPWEIEEDDYGDELWFGGEGCGLITVNGWSNGGCKRDPEAWAKLQDEAHLIAAAPELLAVLKAFSDYVHQEQSATDGAVTYSTTAINHWAFLARAAIAKATGGAA